jgi:hypothetical protein
MRKRWKESWVFFFSSEIITGVAVSVWCLCLCYCWCFIVMLSL